MTVPKIVLRAAGKLLRGILPEGWRVPLEYYLFVLSRDCEPELKFLERICSEREVAVDVGANYGYYAYKMTKLFSKVYAIEANPELVCVLKSFASRKLEVVSKGLSSRSGTADLLIPRFRQRLLPGWGSLDPEDFPDAEGFQRVEVELTTLDSLNIRPLSLIKIDVEGHEVAVLQGAKRTLAECRPVVIVEVRERNIGEVQSFFTSIGYTNVRLQELVGVPGSRENLIFVPARVERQPPIQAS